MWEAVPEGLFDPGENAGNSLIGKFRITERQDIKVSSVSRSMPSGEIGSAR